MDYEQKYREALERAKKVIKECGDNHGRIKMIEQIFPELAEREEERIRKEIIEYLRTKYEDPNAIRYDYKKWIAWLENKGHDGKKWIYEDVYIKDKEQTFQDGIDEVLENPQRYGLEKQGEQKLCMIQWKGNNLKDVLDFTGKSKNFDKWFKSFEEFEKYVREHNNIFKLFNSDGSHFEVPIDAWIIKTPDGYNVASRAIFKPKPDGKVESKFKVGDWIVQENIGVYKVIEICKSWYEVIDFEDNHYSISFDNEHMCHLWTIQDAKDGDVLYHKNPQNGIEYIVMSKGINDYDNIDSYFRYNSANGFAINVPSVLSANLDNINPATKEQRNFLFQIMKEAGYEWDEDKKELKKIEHESDWSEEDEKKIMWLVRLISTAGFRELDNDKMPCSRSELLDWLKSLKPQSHWKPSKEQMEALLDILHPDEPNFYELKSLYQDLQKL